MLVYAALFAVICGERRRLYINDYSEKELDIPCSLSGQSLASLRTVWYRTRIDPRSGLPTGNREKIFGPKEKLVYFQAKEHGSVLSITRGSNRCFRRSDKCPSKDVDGTLGMKDQAIFQCQVFDKEKLLEDNEIILVVARKPMPDELQPVIIDEKPSISAGIDFVYNVGFKGTLATCQSGHANPEPTIRWEVYKDGKLIETIRPTSRGESFDPDDNPIIIDDDDQDMFHSVGLNLRIQKGLSTKYHGTIFKCVVTYGIALAPGLGNALSHVEYTADFPTTGDVIKVKHPVSAVTFQVDNQPAENYIDLTYGIPAVTCTSDGYDPTAPNEVRNPDNNMLKADIERIKVKKDFNEKVHVDCNARNTLNSKWIFGAESFSVKFIGDVKTVVHQGVRWKDPSHIELSAEGTVQDIAVDVYPKVLTGTIDSISAAKSAIAELESSGPGKKATCQKSVCGFMAERKDYTAVVKIPGTSVAKVVQIPVANEKRQETEFRIEKNPPIVGRWKEAEEDRIRFWKNSATAEKIRWMEITNRLPLNKLDYPESLPESGVVAKHIPSPSGGQYVVCYDLGDAAADVRKTDELSFRSAAHAIFQSQEAYCKFYDVAPPSRSKWWLWIIIVIIMLILIAAAVWWTKNKKEEEEGKPEETPKLIAMQSEDAVEDEFAESREVPQVPENTGYVDYTGFGISVNADSDEEPLYGAINNSQVQRGTTVQYSTTDRQDSGMV